ncbi:LuxR family transcriptional regulator [Mycolicibacter heraklionensis]|uniref:LuxR family transcriptional regulator n=1 Tax=Mycolicibacter heraklionensis TaxID=512402 RepID=A0A9X7WF34_9MYCO|nr:LuxR family transcriptional regulator [Mycolicibacter heraklionensis]QZA06692.1 LuxR family transcriptional regulator [Mycolicibacter heraklionensis]
MLATMSEDSPLVNGTELGVTGLLPTGTVTLLLADVEGSTRLWETQPDEMTAAVGRLDRALAEIVPAHIGVRPVEQGEGDSFVVAFARASDAVACALALQRAPLAPIRLRIGVHTGEVQLRDECNYIGPTINRAGRIRDLAHGGQTLLSGTTEDLVVEALPAEAWLIDLGSHELRGVPRPERVAQLCHPELDNEFPPLRTTTGRAAGRLPVQLTSFVGRGAEIADVQALVAENRLVMLTGAGGTGKTRLAIEIAARIAPGFRDGVCYVDLAPITVPEVVPVTAARALGLIDQPGRSTTDALVRFLADRQILIVLDNCEHLLDASAALVVSLLGCAPHITVLATSREPLGVPGEATWQVPSLSLGDEAVELFADRARLVRADFAVTPGNTAAVAEICRRLDGMPLAIELAAARVRALSLAEIVDSLHDRFRLLAGGSRTAVRRQQTLRASVDWSHALLTDTERVLFRRLAVFLGGFDLDAAQAVAGADGVQRYQVLEQLSLLIDKSLVVAENNGGRTRYRLLETVRQYALEKLGESGEADAVRSRHRDHYTAMAALLDAPARTDYEQRIEQAEIEMDNLRTAFGWSLEDAAIEPAMVLASSLQPMWLTRGRVREGLAWFEAVLTAERAHGVEVNPALRAQALADSAVLGLSAGTACSMDSAEQALTIARGVGDPALLARALTAYGYSTAYNAEMAEPYFAEAVGLARASDDRWRLSQILGWQATAAIVAGDPLAARAAAAEGLAVAEAIGDRFDARQCRYSFGTAQQFQGDLDGAVAQLDTLVTEAEEVHDLMSRALGLGQKGFALAYRGDTNAARAAVDAALIVGAELGDGFAGFAHMAATVAALSAGDVEAARDSSESANQRLSAAPGLAAVQSAFYAQAALAAGDLAAARVRADEAVATTTGWYLMVALTTRARVAIGQGDVGQAARDTRDALTCCTDMESYLGIPDIFECLAALAADAGSHRDAVRIYGAAESVRERIGAPRFKTWDHDYLTSVNDLRKALGEKEFDTAWAEGAALSTEEAIAYVQRGRGGRKRPPTGWDSLTPSERDVVKLVREGLSNKDIGARLFISSRTVQVHLTHIYAKLGLTSRMHLAQEAARRG